MGRAKRLQNVHPGEVLVEEFLKPLGVTQYELAKRVRVPMTRIAEICRRRRRRAITADTALRLG
jgi:addiction module HigA family antidote